MNDKILTSAAMEFQLVFISFYSVSPVTFVKLSFLISVSSVSCRNSFRSYLQIYKIH